MKAAFAGKPAKDTKMSKARAVPYGRDYYQRCIAQLMQMDPVVDETNDPGAEARLWLSTRMKLLICRYSSGESMDTLRSSFAATVAYLTEEQRNEPSTFFDLDDFDQYYLAVSMAAWCTLAGLPKTRRERLIALYHQRYPEPEQRDPLLDRLLVGNRLNTPARLRHRAYRPLLDAWRTLDDAKAQLILNAYLCQLDRRLADLSWQRDQWTGKVMNIGLWCFAAAVIVIDKNLDPSLPANLPTFPDDCLTVVGVA